MGKRVSVFMDVEDPINPLADDAALEFARLFSEAGVRGSFCLTGEKCRTLLARGRRDVAEAFAPHCLGLHTDTHSFHSTTMELLADVPFEEGCELAYEAEKKGFDAFVALFGRPPAFWGGAGNTWSPEITEALKRLGIPAYVYALTGNVVHRFNGVTALPQHLSIGEETWMSNPVGYEAIDAVNQPWVGLFVGHPTRFRYSEFWDKPYHGGRTPPSPEFAEPTIDDRYEAGKANLYRFLVGLKDRVIGVDEALALPWSFRDPTAEELAAIQIHTAANLRGAVGWPVHRPGLSVERIVEKTLALGINQGARISLAIDIEHATNDGIWRQI